MSHWAEIDANNIVLRVTVGGNDEPDEGYQWLIDNLGGTWVKTSYNGTIRKNFAGIGYTYDSTRDAFIPPKPEPMELGGIKYDFILDETTCLWVWDIPAEYQVTEDETPFV
jgi:hypothetical protein